MNVIGRLSQNLLEGTKKKCEKKKIMSFPPIWDWDDTGEL